MNELDEIRHEKLKGFQSMEEVAGYFYSLDEKKWVHRISMYDEYGAELVTYFTLCKQYVLKTIDKCSYICSTIHKCKGLEFDHVKLAEDFPLLVMNNTIVRRNTEIWKERYNTIYVAITRAKLTLTLNSSLTSWIKIHTDCKKYYSIGRKDTCRECGTSTTLYTNDIPTCMTCRKT